MIWREFFTPPATLFHSDPQAVEAVTGWYIATLSFWCWLAGSFGDFLPKLAALHGWEWAVAAVGIPYGIRHAFRAHSRNLNRRAQQAFIASGLMMAFAVLLLQNQSWRVFGVPALVLGAIVQAWVYLRLRRIIA